MLSRNLLNHASLGLVVAALLAAPGCVFDDSVLDGVVCETQDDCPPGTTCTGGFCIPSDQDTLLADTTGRDVQDTMPDAPCDNCAEPSACCSVPGSGPTCVNILTDPENCGGCGFGCPDGLGCLSGVCRCAQGTTDCDGNADNGCETHLLDDEANCGACGAECVADAECVDGSCSCGADGTCQSGATCCADGEGARFCVTLRDDAQNCGACGVVCGEGEVCASGQCACGAVVVGGGKACQNVGEVCCGGLVCVNPMTDPTNCGACGVTCGANQGCSAGACTCLSADETRCGVLCVDTRTDEANCGACGLACRADQTCSDGICVCADSAFGECDGTCVNLQSDPVNCGSCANTCAATQTCADGSCVCSAGLAFCAGACVNTQNDNSHCGVCGRTCGTGQTCVAGNCTCSNAALTLCAGSCVDTNTSGVHCGACNAACTQGTVCCGGACAKLGSVQGCPGTSCKDLLQQGVTTSGIYWVRAYPTDAPFRTYCDMTTDGGGWTLVQRTVWSWTDTQALLTNYATFYSQLKGTPDAGRAYRVAGKYWPRLQDTNEHLMVFRPRFTDGTACNPLYYKATGGVWVVPTAGGASITNAVQPVELFRSTQFSTTDDGPSASSCVVAGQMVPWAYGACCSTCPTLGGTWWSDAPHPSASVLGNADIFGNRLNMCTGALEKSPRNAGVVGIDSMEYFVR